jgi:hypothetical protein
MSKKLGLKDTPIRSKSRIGQLVKFLSENGYEFAMNADSKPIAVNLQDEYFHLVDSQEFEDLLNLSWYDFFTGQFLQPNDLKLLMSLIREDCRKGGKYLTEVEIEENQEHPIVQLVLEFMCDAVSFDGTTARLRHELQSYAKRLNIYGDETISPFTTIFSRQLRRLIPVLAECGIDVVMKRTEKGSHTILRRNAKFQLEASYPPTAIGPTAKTDDRIVYQSSVATIDDTPSSGMNDDSDGKSSSDEQVDLPVEQSIDKPVEQLACESVEHLNDSPELSESQLDA